MTYEEYYNQWQLSVESRDMAFDEWLCLMLDKRKAIDDAELHQRFEKVLNGQKWDLIDKAWEYFMHDVRINYIHTFGTEPREGVMEKCKENWIKAMEE